MSPMNPTNPSSVDATPEQVIDGVSLRDRATRPAAQAPAGLGDTASIANADDLARAEKFRRGIGGSYDRDVGRLAEEFAQSRRDATDYAVRLCELVEAEAWGNPAEQAGANNCAKAIRGWSAS